MRILLSDGSGLTSRQVASQAAAAGHQVDVVAPTRIGLAGFSRDVRRVHRVPPLGRDPYGWLEATLAVLERHRHDVLLPTQEQVAVLAREAASIRALGVGLAVPSFASLARVQDKVAQAKTLAALGLPHPRTTIAPSVEELLENVSPPAFLKAPIGTASSGVVHVTDRGQIAAATERLEREGAFEDGGVVVQAPASGPLVMVQAVFMRGRLLAWHANERVREGLNGGASSKRSVALPAVGEDLQRLGEHLEWHGAIALDAVLDDGVPTYIDINPRLVEPGNAWAAGVDLVDTMLKISTGDSVDAQPPGASGIRTHQLLSAVLAAAQRKRHARRSVALELALAIAGAGPYRDSTEELTPLWPDAVGALPLGAVAAVGLAMPQATASLAGNGVAAYALTAHAWRLVANQERPATVAV